MSKNMREYVEARLTGKSFSSGMPRIEQARRILGIIEEEFSRNGLIYDAAALMTTIDQPGEAGAVLVELLEFGQGDTARVSAHALRAFQTVLPLSREGRMWTSEMAMMFIDGIEFNASRCVLWAYMEVFATLPIWTMSVYTKKSTATFQDQPNFKLILSELRSYLGIRTVED